MACDSFPNVHPAESTSLTPSPARQPVGAGGNEVNPMRRHVREDLASPITGTPRVTVTCAVGRGSSKKRTPICNGLDRSPTPR